MSDCYRIRRLKHVAVFSLFALAFALSVAIAVGWGPFAQLAEPWHRVLAALSVPFNVGGMFDEAIGLRARRLCVSEESVDAIDWAGRVVTTPWSEVTSVGRSFVPTRLIVRTRYVYRLLLRLDFIEDGLEYGSRVANLWAAQQERATRNDG